MEGTKHDQGKPRWDLMPWKELEEIVKVITHGAEKYEPENWKGVDPERFVAALLRHFTEWRKGERVDQDSGLSHLSHATCCLLFLMWHDSRPGEIDLSEIRTMSRAHRSLDTP